MRNFFRLFFVIIFLTKSSVVFAALPFVTDDSAVSAPNQLMLETYTEFWHLPKKNEVPATDMIGQYFGFSYGLKDDVEVTTGGIISYDLKDNTPSLSNPLLQLKKVVYRANPEQQHIPNVALSAGYVNKNGRGQYYDNASNSYLLAIATSRFFDNNLIVHFNSGVKSAYKIVQQDNEHRLHLGIGFDIAIIDKDIRLLLESYNGAPASPRDSPDYFRSYQIGLKWVKHADTSFNITYGSQPTFSGYDSNNHEFYRRTNWVQFGMRKAIDDLF
jgi:hypothetical protein